MGNEVYLKNIANISAGSSAPKEDYLDTEGVPFIRAGNLEELINGVDINTLAKINEKHRDKLKLKKASENSILFAKSGMSSMKNRVYKVEKESYFVNHLACVTVKDKNVDVDYLKYFFEWFKPSSLVRDESYPSIRLSDISNIKINLPSIKIQEKVAATLNETNKVLKLRQQQIEALSALKQSVFFDMFDTVSTNKYNFKIDILGNYTTLVTSGSTPRGGAKSYLDEGIPLIRSQNVLWNEFDISDVAYIAEETHESMRRSQLNNKDVLFNITGASIGRCSVYEGDNNSANVNQHVCIIRLNDKINPYYLSYFLTGIEFQKNVVSKNIGATRQAFNYTQIKNFNLLIPDISLQNEFEDKVKQIDASISSAKESLRQYNSLYETLLCKAFNGELFKEEIKA